VLYIEDDAANVHLVERLLQRREHVNLRVATSAHDGVQAAIDELPDLILLDNRLPDGTGSDVLLQLSSTESTAAIPVVVLTGDSGATVDGLLAMGATEFLAKPYDIYEFLDMIDRYI